MTRTYALLSIVGGHFLLGRRLRGITLLIILGVLPFITPVIVVMVYPNVVFLQSEFVFPSTYIVLLVAVWLGSAVLIFRTAPSAAQDPHAGGRRWEAAIAALFAWLLVGFGLLFHVVGPFLAASTKDGPLTIFSGRTPIWTTPPLSPPRLLDVLKPLPPSDGDLVIRGKLMRNGAPAPNEEVRLLFAPSDGSPAMSSPAMRTDDKGQFSFRMPTGTWRDAGPLIGPKGEGEVREEIDGPFDHQTRSFHVDRGPPSRDLSILVTVHIGHSSIMAQVSLLARY